MKRPRRARVRPTLAHGVMVLAGLLTFVLVAATLRERGASVPVLVAGEAVDAGTPLAAAALTTVDVPAGSALLDGLVPAGGDRAGVALARPLQPGDPVRPGDLLPTGATSSLRSVALPVERLVIDGLGLRVGDRVDVIAVDPDGSSAFVAVDVGVARLPSQAALGLGRTVDTATTWLTLGVSDGQALDLAAAVGHGELVIARSTGADPIDPAVAGGRDLPDRDVTPKPGGGAER